MLCASVACHGTFLSSLTTATAVWSARVSHILHTNKTFPAKNTNIFSHNFIWDFIHIEKCRYAALWRVAWLCGHYVWERAGGSQSWWARCALWSKPLSMLASVCSLRPWPYNVTRDSVTGQHAIVCVTAQHAIVCVTAQHAIVCVTV